MVHDKNDQLIRLFAVPVFRCLLRNENEQAIKQKIRNIEYNYADDDGSNLLKISKNVNILELEEFVSLKQEIESKIKFYLEEVLCLDTSKIEFYIISSWVTRLGPQGFGRKHNHNLSIFSGVFYIDTDEKSSKIYFYNDRNNFSTGLIPLPIKTDSYNDINSESFWFPPYQNSMVLFPSHIPHSVGINESSNDRFSLAFDVFVKGSFKKGLHGYLDIK